ncbi:hypothetical protein [Agromyces humi]|uniref:hypothetical protein n=1 Tax=Agromyces humi TaxID=1766800 RepID=UPI00135A902D|nr:hypothetical protein [Agromyces humi]
MPNPQSALVTGTPYRRKSDGVMFRLVARFPHVMLKQSAGGPLITTSARLSADFEEVPDAS